MGAPSQFEAVQNVTRRIKSDIAEDRAQSWESVRDRIKADFAEEFRDFYNRALIRSPDGSDLIAEVAGDIAPQIRSDTVGRMRDALVSAAENAPRVGALWSSTRQEIIGANSAAIGMLAQHSQPAPDGDALLDDALREIGDGVWFVTKEVGGRDVEFLTNRRPKCNNSYEGNEGGENGPADPSNFRWVAVLLSIIAGIAALIGVAVWDILPIPIPCDLPIFSLLPRC